MANPTSQEPPSKEAESAKWREEELLNYGFDKDQAKHLMTIAGLNVATIREKFISKGCSAELAYRILS
jgi:hypothetical protein